MWLNLKKKFTYLVADEMSNLRPIFPRWQGFIRLVWKQYCFGRICWSVEMLQWFAVFDFVLILSLIQISLMSWSRATKDCKNNKNDDILNDLVEQLWSFFCILKLTSFESYFIWVGFVDIFEDGCVVKGLPNFESSKFGYNLLCSTNHEKRRSTLSFKLFACFFFF